MDWAVLFILSLSTCANTFIIPDDIPTILSVVYSNIPPIKLGLDTRFGLGFRLGPHADFQTLIEIGPQENTRPINETLAKRQSPSQRDKRLRVINEALPLKQDNNTAQLSLADILMGRKVKMQMKELFNDIEFKKVPGIDDLKKSSKKTKSAKNKPDKSPTKFVILK